MLTMDIVERLDRDCETSDLARCVRNENLRDQDNTVQIAIIAERLRVDSDTVYSYIWLKNLIEESDGEDGSYEAAIIFAEQCGINFDDFQDYLGKYQDESAIIGLNDFPLLRDTSAVADDVAERDLRQQEEEAFLNGMNLYQWREYIADLQNDVIV